MPILSAIEGSHHCTLGSTNVVSGAAISQQTYYAYGLPRTTEGTLPTDYTFTGQRQDASDGLLYYGARYYEASLNRCTQPDSIIPDWYNPQSLNRYSYTLNNPVKYTDPSGHRECDGNDSDFCADEDAFRSEVLVNQLHAQLGVNVSTDFSLEALRTIRTGLYDIANAAGDTSSAKRALEGLNIIHDSTAYNSYQMLNVVTLDNNSMNASAVFFEKTVVHEAAHFWAWKSGNPIEKLFNTDGEIVSQMAQAIGTERGPTDYGRSSITEDWAESVSVYLVPEYVSTYLRNINDPRENWNLLPGGGGPGLGPRHLDFVRRQTQALGSRR